MFSLKKLLLLSVAVIGATNAAPLDPGSDSLAVRDSTAPPVIPKAVEFSAPDLVNGDSEKRETSRTRLFWSPQGRFLFMMNLGKQVPQAVIDGFTGIGEAGPGKVLMQNFLDWVRSVQLEYGDRDGALRAVTQAINNAADKGGMYSKGGQTSYVGWAVQLATTDQNVINSCAKLINDWATVTGRFPSLNAAHNVVALAISQRPNDFISLAQINGGTTSKRDAELYERYTCPANFQMLNYATADVPDNVDFNHGVRFVGLC